MREWGVRVSVWVEIKNVAKQLLQNNVKFLEMESVDDSTTFGIY